MSYYKKLLKQYMKENPWLRDETTYDASFTQNDFQKMRRRDRLISIRQQEANTTRYEGFTGIRVAIEKSRQVITDNVHAYLAVE